MATTTNFGWETPDDTDLVKDGAAAMRTLGNSIDTSFVDLKGGTTGQVLSKASNTDLDFTWVTDAGDISGVTAGTGISGGGTSGTVTITNSMATEITAAGDIIMGTGSGTFDNLPIGTTGQVLTADTTVSPYKVKWATPAAASFVGCSVYKSGNQSINNNTYTALTWDLENYDTDSIHSTASNTSRFTVPTGKGGKWMVSGTIQYGSNATGQRGGAIYLNGSVYCYTNQINATSALDCILSSAVVLSLSAGDYVEFYGWQNSGGALDVKGNTTGSIIQFSYLGA